MELGPEIDVFVEVRVIEKSAYDKAVEALNLCREQRNEFVEALGEFSKALTGISDEAHAKYHAEKLAEYDAEINKILGEVVDG
ncbi:hypothetical protein D3C87_1849540 [compost metagenome]